MVGPGVLHLGVENDVWSDHTDTRPTMLALLGLKDDYTHEGRALIEVLSNSALPVSLRVSRSIFIQLAQAFKQINAPVGKLGLKSLRISTKALESSSPGDSTYQKLESKLSTFTTERNEIVSRMLVLLEGAEFNHSSVNVQQARQLIAQANSLLQQVE